MKLQFFGGVRTVTGSRCLVSDSGFGLLVDVGLFQGLKELRLRNWGKFEMDPASVDAAVLTHAHLDHSGALPLLVKSGFKGTVYCTKGTKDLCGILLPDSGYLQEEDAKFANKKGFSKHHPALPLYTYLDAVNSLRSLRAMPWTQPFQVGPFQVSFHRAGHLLGASTVLIKNKKKSVIFSGDLGRKEDLLVKDPDFHGEANALVIESTYGDRSHPKEDSFNQLAKAVNDTLARGGTLLIPSFAVGRAQTMMLILHRLKEQGKIPQNLPVYLNSPMATDANRAYMQNAEDLKLSATELREIWSGVQMVGTPEESKSLVKKSESAVIIAASGMAVGGRVLHHLKTILPDPKNTVLFVGFQAAGTRGSSMLSGAPEVKIHGELWPVRAKILSLDSLSAHGDREDLLSWVMGLSGTPDKIFVNHGETSASEALARSLGPTALVPEPGMVYDL